MAGEVRRREVWYTLEREDATKTILEPIATYATYLAALADGKKLDVGPWHHKIKRFSNPVFPRA